MTNNDKLKLTQNIALISGIFCTVVALLLLLNYWQVSQSDPIESKALEALVERLNEEPNNEELKEEIRNFDLLARKAYFNSQWQIETGAWLLLIGAIVLAVSLRYFYTLKAKIERPEKELENEIASRIIAQKGIIITGAVIFVLAFIASFVTVDQLEHYQVETVADAAPSSPEDEGIEVIDVSETPQEETTESPAGEVTETDPQSEQEADPETEADATQQSTAAEEPVQEKETVASGQPAVSAGLTLEQLKNNHNSFRGPLGQGIIYHENIPTEWDGESGTNVLWKTTVPKHGYNSPIVWDNKVFLAGADEASREVYCFNANTGELIWTGVADNIPGSPSTLPRVTEDTGLSASTMTTDGKRVFAIFATGDVIAFDMNGNRVWAKNLGVPDNHYGHSSSLITWDGKLFIQFDTNRGGRVIALDVATGETVWDTQRDANISWASPVLAEIDGEYQLLLTADPIVAGYNINNGEEIWAVEAMMGEVGPSVAYSDGIVFAANEYAQMVAIDASTHEIIWDDNMYLPEASSPLAQEGLLIIATSYGVLVCYDAKTGEQHWEHDVGTTLYSSPMVVDGKLYMMDNDGVMRIYDFAKEMNLISENALGETFGTSPAFGDGRIYIRGEENLYCIGK
jgi:outer membrane protein assembly factor BamB